MWGRHSDRSWKAAGYLSAASINEQLPVSATHEEDGLPRDEKLDAERMKEKNHQRVGGEEEAAAGVLEI